MFGGIALRGYLQGYGNELGTSTDKNQLGYTNKENYIK